MFVILPDHKHHIGHVSEDDTHFPPPFIAQLVFANMDRPTVVIIIITTDYVHMLADHILHSSATVYTKYAPETMKRSLHLAEHTNSTG